MTSRALSCVFALFHGYNIIFTACKYYDTVIRITSHTFNYVKLTLELYVIM